ncbi:MAG TPA: SDR family oxidoreductase [Acidimicrobiia bacterium]|nr:SDR family oxidoreductase [Acidimicrobiia bacterium]
MNSLVGMTAVVTAGSRNLGAEIVGELASRGASTISTFRSSPDVCSAMLERLPTAAGQIHRCCHADLESPQGIESFVEELAGFEQVDILINNFGPFSMTPFADMTEDEWDRIWNGNVEAARRCSRAVVAAMRNRGRGRIVNVSAGSAYIRNHSIYTLAKAALITLTEMLALELGPEISVNGVAPGQIAESADDIAEFDSDFVVRAIEHTPMGRLVSRSEVACITVDLCEPRFDAVTGVVIPVDGGWRLNRF